MIECMIERMIERKIECMIGGPVANRRRREVRWHPPAGSGRGLHETAPQAPRRPLAAVVAYSKLGSTAR